MGQKYSILTKILPAITLICFAAGFSSCGFLDKDEEESGGDSTITWDAVFIPDDLSSKTLAGIYTGAYSDSSETQGFKESGTYAFCLYEDGTFAETYKGTYTNTKTGTTTKVEKGVWKGTYTKVEGDYTNGKFTIKITLQWDSEANDWGNLNQTGTINLLISGGAFKFEGISYGKKEIKTSGSGSSGSGGSSSSGSGSSSSGVTLPSEFHSKSVSAVFYYSEYNSYLSENGSPYAAGTLSSSGLTVSYGGNTETFPRLQ